MKNILWLTGDYFLDVDREIVPSVRRQYNCRWIVFRMYGSSVAIDKSLDCEIIFVPYRQKDPRIIGFYAKLVKQLMKDSSDFVPDIIYNALLGVPFFYPILLHKVKNVPIVHAAHNVKPYDGWPDKWLMTNYVNYVFKNNGYFHLFSKFLYDYVVDRYPQKKSFYAPLSLKDYGEVRTNKYDVSKDHVNILFFGNVKDNKRLDVVINAFNSLTEPYKSKIHLTIAGKCDDIPKYESLIAGNLHISCFFKRIDDEDIPELFVKHHYLILPYENVAQSGPHMIAYRYNMPTIVSDIEGFKERTHDGVDGFMFKVNDVASLTEVLRKVADLNEDSYESLKHNLKEFVDLNFMPEIIVKRYLDFFDAIC